MKEWALKHKLIVLVVQSNGNNMSDDNLNNNIIKKMQSIVINNFRLLLIILFLVFLSFILFQTYNYFDILNIKKNSGDLSLWAEQGVLLLNSALTVREHCPNSHQKHWRNFTNHAIEYLSNNTSGVVFILWGNNAKQKEKLIDTSKHHILKATHPSPLSANRGGFFGCKHFSQTNQILENQNMTPIQW